MNEKFSILFIKVVKARSRGSQDVVRFKAYHIMEEASKLVLLTPHLYVWARILLEERVMLHNLLLQSAQLKMVVFHESSLPKHI